MKKSKIGVIALLTTLTVSSVSVGVVMAAGLTPNSIQTIGGASCVLTWDQNNAPELDKKGAGEGLAGTVLTNYVNSTSKKGYHVSLLADGEMKNSGAAYDTDLELGGIVNGIQSINIEYVNNSEMIRYRNPYYDGPDSGQPEFIEEHGLSLRLNITHNGHYSYTSNERDIKSGETITLSGDNIGNEFSLSTSKSSNVENKDIKGSIDIKKVVITCTTEVRRHVTIEGDRDILNKLEYAVIDKDNNRLRFVDDFKRMNFAKGDKFALKVKDSINNETLDRNEMVISNATLETKKISDDKNTSFIFTVGDGEVNVKINKLIGLNPYTGRSFVGKYALIDPSDLSTVYLEIHDDAKYTFNGQSSTYYADESDKVTLNDYKKKILDFTIFENGLACLTYAKYNVNTIVYYYGFMGEKTSIETYARNSNEVYGYYGKISNFDNSKSCEIFTYDSMTTLLGDGVEASLNGSSISDSQIITLKETRTKNVEDKDFNIMSRNLNVYFDVSGENKIASTYFKINSSNATYTSTKIDKTFYGTFTCKGQPDLILDGLGGYQIGNEKGRYDSKWYKRLVITPNNEYIVDEKTMTYTIVIKDPDPFKTATTFKNGDVQFKFEKLKVVITDNVSWDSPSRAEDYVVDGKLIKFDKFYFEPDPEEPGSMGGLLSGEVKFIFELSNDGKTLTLKNNAFVGNKLLYPAGYVITKI